MNSSRLYTAFLLNYRIFAKILYVEKSNENSVSLNKYISNTGICSRREADQLITKGRVRLNGVVAQTGNRVFEGDVVLLDNKSLSSPPKTTYVAFHKPVGIVCTTDLRENKNIISYINHPQRLFPIGRLDKPSEGLIFLTNDGDIVNKILRAGNNHEKEYIVSVKQPITSEFCERMRSGVPILGTMTLPCKMVPLSDFKFKITLTQGLNRQIRRMCEYLNYDVTSLKRTRIMNIALGNLPLGKWRELTKQEVKEIMLLVEKSSKTEEASGMKKKRK